MASTSSAPMFGSNIAICGGSFNQAAGNVIYNSNNRAEAFKLLVKRVSICASLDRKDSSRCHRSTRVAILQRMCDWVMEFPKDRKTWFMWLYGAAGAGKSSIMQTLAELLLSAPFGIIVASFFFFRADSNRNTMAPLVATLAYQLMQAVPETADDIFSTVESNPLIFDQTIEFQFRLLIMQPFLRLPISLRRLFAIFVDGLDECINQPDQFNLIKVLQDFSSDPAIPIVFIVASRREPQIEAAFFASPTITTVSLDNLDAEQASDDIWLFLIEELEQIRTKHLRKHLLPTDWPPLSIVNELTEKASGQFIFPSVVINYVSSARANPKRRLDVIHGVTPKSSSTPNPFAHLDSLYLYIFSGIPTEYLSNTLDILAYHLITGHKYVNVFEQEPGAGEIEIVLADLAAVVKLERGSRGYLGLEFLHAPLADFLQDKCRSQQFFINFEEYRIKLLCMFLQRKIPDSWSLAYDWDAIAQQEFTRLRAILFLLNNTKPSDGQRLRSAVLEFNSAFHYVKIDIDSSNASARVKILAYLKSLDFGDKGQAYRHALAIFGKGYAKFWRLHNDKVKVYIRKSPDLCACICQMRPELASDPALDPESKWKSIHRR